MKIHEIYCLWDDTCIYLSSKDKIPKSLSQQLRLAVAEFKLIDFS